jgi:hypothetical protein
MEFFNKKEEVIDLQLTQYGKYLLSMGKLKPAFYAFFDEDIVYDSKYGTGPEEQSDAEKGIQSDTPSLKVQYNFHSIEDEMEKAWDLVYDNQSKQAHDMMQVTPEKTKIMTAPLANSALGSDRMPAWDITMIGAKFVTGSSTYTWTLKGSNATKHIPQLSASITYDVSVAYVGGDTLMDDDDFLEAVEAGNLDGVDQGILDDALDENSGDQKFGFRTFDDGTYFDIDEQDIIIQIIENNVDFDNNNFEIELFRVEDNLRPNGDTIQQLTPLKFEKPLNLLVNGILYEPYELNIEDTAELEIDSSFADYYFDISTDKQIPSQLICSNISTADKDKYKYILEYFDCEDNRQQPAKFSNPYSVKDEEESCEG